MFPRTREQQLVDVARRARRYFHARAEGRYIGDTEDLAIGRELVAVLALFEDVEPIADADRRDWLKRREAALVELEARR